MQCVAAVPDAVLGDAKKTTPFAPSSSEFEETTLGPYQLRGLIAEGGMGMVYEAYQEEPVRRTVAVKIIKPGMDSQDVIARFELERQTLALMDHPNIASVLDAGHARSGVSPTSSWNSCAGRRSRRTATRIG